MLAMSSLFPTLGFPLQDEVMSYEQDWIADDLLFNLNHNEWDNIGSFCSSSPLEKELHNSKDSGETSYDPATTKKLNHNASEKIRRKKLNELYHTLQSLLPNTGGKKKLSIPVSVSHAVKYIPQLQRQVIRLVRRKEDILSCIFKQNSEHTSYHVQSNCVKEQSFARVTTSQIGDREIVIQISTPTEGKATFSNVLQNLEENGVDILSVVSVSSENKVFYTLHVEVKENHRVESEMLRKKIISLYVQWQS
ncbi:hypothetical protein ACHQM5_012776 [Ranunculus cassubicifolius]